MYVISYSKKLSFCNIIVYWHELHNLQLLKIYRAEIFRKHKSFEIIYRILPFILLISYKRQSFTFRGGHLQVFESFATFSGSIYTYQRSPNAQRLWDEKNTTPFMNIEQSSNEFLVSSPYRIKTQEYIDFKIR